MMGLHPCSVGVDFENELEEVVSWLERDRFYAIGEIGLDFYHSTEWKLQQVEAFAFQIQLAKRYALPIVIHSRSSMDECIQTIAQEHDTDLKGIFHCFGGDLRQANRITEMGWMLGIGGVLTYKNAGLAKILEEISLENIVLETDAPYLSPVPFRGKRNEPSYIKYIAQKVADIKNISVQEVEALTNANAKKIFSF
jgi:TatD DNase family protein